MRKKLMKIMAIEITGMTELNLWVDPDMSRADIMDRLDWGELRDQMDIDVDIRPGDYAHEGDGAVTEEGWINLEDLRDEDGHECEPTDDPKEIRDEDDDTDEKERLELHGQLRLIKD